MGHPLKKELIIEIGAPDAPEMTARKAIVDVVRYLLGVLDNMEREWLALTGEGQVVSAPLPLPEAPAAEANAAEPQVNQVNQINEVNVVEEPKARKTRKARA
jgi:hypothetical protein